MKKSFLIFLSALLLTFTACFTSCDSWMSDDDFYGEIENDVKVANAAAVSVYVRYANSKMGSTEPSGFTTLKVDVPSTLTAVTNDDYGFVRWVAFSTSDFPTTQQHSNLFYENEDHYAENYLPLELPASEVFFSDPTKTSTKVTLYTTRSDIFITPLVTKRPTVVTSVPSNGRTDVVKNSQIRILFSKPIDESTLVDEFGNSNIQITSGRAVLTESSDDLSALDITHYFDFKLSRTKKMLTISAKKGSDGKAIYKFDNNAQISITLFEDLKDSDGYAMNGSYKFSFTTGTKEDSLAPKIDNLTAGIGQNCLDYQQYKYDNTDTNNKYSILAQNAPADATDRLSAYITESNRLEAANKVPLLNQRVKDKLNIFIRATDIAGAGANLTLDNNNMSENDVALVQVRACLYADKDGNPVTSTAQAFANGSLGTDTTSVLYIREYGYAMGMKDSDCQVRGAFETVTSTQTDQSGTPVPNTSGTLFTYDLSTLDDGLIKIDFWAVDLVGNSGDTEVYAGTYDNGYRSIFVVKDHTAPDAATEVTKVITESGVDSNNNIVAPYEWYNSSSLNKIKVKDLAGSTTTLIHDNNNEFLRSDDKNLKWIFKVGNDPSWAPAPSDSGWTLIHNDSNQPVPRTLSNAVSSTDGRVDVTMCLMDDLGNVSAPVLLNSINYDNTAPVVSSTVSWVKNTSTVANTYTYEPIVATTDKANLSESGHILNIPFTEEWAGLRRIKVTVQKDGTGTPVAQGNYTIRYVPSTGTARDLTYSADGSDNNLKILRGTNAQYDAAPVKTGNLYISGIKIGNENGGTYHVTVDLWDSSLNHSVTSSDISIDTTRPELTKVYIPGLKHSISVTTNAIATTESDHWFLPHEYIRPGASSSAESIAPGYIPLYLFVKEADSGIHKISFASHVVLFNSPSKKTTLYKLDSYSSTPVEIPSSDYTIDISNNTITLVDNPSVKLSSADTNGFVILVKDIGFNGYRQEENQISVTVEDLATLKHIENPATQSTAENNYKSTLTVDLSENITASGVFADSYLSLTPTATLADRGADSEHLSAVSGYTNEAVINLTVTLNSDSTSLSACSGHNKINLSGASFIDEGDNKTVVKVGNVTIPYELSADKKTITLRNKNATTGAFTNDYIVIRSTTPVQISNILLDDSSEATRSVTLKSYDLTGWESSSVTKSIIYDYQAPELYKGPYTANRNDDHKTKVYPHYKDGEEGENQTGIEINGVKTFYTNTTAWSDSTAKSAGLGIKAKDAVSLYGSITSRDASFLMCYKHGAGDSASTVDKAKVIASGSFVTSTKTNGIESTWVPSGTAANEETNAMFEICFETGTYSAVIVDKAGNCSDVFHFAIKEDSTADNTDLQNRVLIQRPDTGSEIYRNNTTSVDSFNNKTMRTKKYVTKKSSSKYTLILNLGATYQAPAEKPTTKLDGTAIETVTAYSELEATATSSPIEYYSVSSKYIYYPDSEDSTTHIAAACDNNWLEFKANSEHITDSTNNITSYVDGNKNIIIELPNTQSTAPVTVFLKDACDNTWDIVLGKKIDPNDSRKVFATSYIIDDKLGYAATDANGEVVTPIVMQNPYMTSGAGESEGPAWGSEGRYKWNNQSGNTDGNLTSQNAVESYGEHQHFGFFRDVVKKATYYNPDINSAQSVKIGLTLRFGQAYNTRTNPESVTFKIDENQKAPAADVTAKKYTARALLYCTQSNTKPTKQDILDCYNLEFGTNGVAGVATGRITDWTYVQANNSTTTSEVTLLLDYPKPDYSKLTDWTLKNSNNEPEPYYIWYLYEDRVGNYEIAKIVNSGAVGDALKALKTDTSEMYDRWFYDAEKPKITIRGETTNPEDIESTSTNVENSRAGVNKLVATNNGYVPYLVQGVTTGTVYVSASQNHTIRSTNPNLKNENVGNGTTHHVEEAGDDAAESVGSKNRTWLPFFDIEISEATGVRAFCWSNSSTAPAFDIVQSTNNTQGDYSSTGAWYAGYTETNLNADIGCDFHYDGSTNGRDATNSYFSYTASTSEYKGVYSGTKVNTVIPFNRISSGSPLWLHVMDWTGNVQSVRMGKNLVYAKDITKPVITTTGVYPVSKPNEYYISKDDNQTIPVLRIAGKGTKAIASQNIEVELPGISDDVTGILGYYLGDSPVYDYSPTTTPIKEKLVIPSTVYSQYKTSTGDLTYYVYDKVGNISQGSLKIICDEDPPELENVTINISGTGNKMLAAGDTSTSTSKQYTGSASYVANPASATLNKVYINSNKVASFEVNLTAACVADNDLASIEIYQWNADQSKWVKKDSVNATSGQSQYSISSTNISYDASGTIYQILATDMSGNTSCQYFKLFLDNAAPTFTANPVVTVSKGSVNKIPNTSNPVEYAYYANAANEEQGITAHPMEITFTATDAGVGTINKAYEYKVDDGEWTAFDGSAAKELSFTTASSVQKIYLRDILGNTTAANACPTFAYTYGSTTVNDIGKLVNYAGQTVTAPAMNKISVMTKASWTDYMDTYYTKNDAGKYIVFKSRDSAGIKLTFDTTGLTNIMGYIDATSSAYSAEKDAYSLLDLTAESTVVKKVFKYESLPMKPNYVDVYRKYYAIDYAGNKSAELEIKFTYNNPEAAQNVEFVPADSTIITFNSDLQSALQTNGITLAPSYYDETGNTLYYQKNGYVLIRCTLNVSGTGTYPANHNPTPKIVTLYDTSTGTNAHGTFKIDDNTLKRITLGEKVNPDTDDSRYYCYLAFKLGDNQNGYKLHCVIEGDDSKTDKLPLFSSTGSEITWTQDAEAPAITGDYYETGDSVKKLYNYAFSSDANAVEVEDSYIGYWLGGFKSISYVTGTKVYFPPAAFTDASKISEYKIVTTLQKDSSNLAYNASAAATTNTTGWQTLVLKGEGEEHAGNYEIALPDVTQPHRHIAIFLRDIFGNVSEAYYLGHKAHSDWQWWILDKTVAKTDVTSTSRVGTTTQFEIRIPAGTIIKTLEATGGATITGVTINGYPNDSSKQPGYDSTSHKLTSYQGAERGWIIVEDAKNTTPTFNPGFKVTLNIPDADWGDTANVIRIKINGVEIDTDGKQLLTIQPKTFTKDNIQLKLDQATMSGGNFVIPVELTDGAPASKITEVAANPSSVRPTWDADNKTITLKNLPDPSWNTEQKISIKINKNDDFTFADVLTIGKLTLGIESGSLDPATLDGNHTSVSFKLSKSGNLTINSVSADGTLGNISDPDENGVYTLTAVTDGKIPQNAAISIVTSYGNVTNHSVTLALSTGTLTHNNNIRGTGFTAGGITAFGGGAGSGDTAGSRITQFFNNVANVFVADSTAEKPVAQNKQAEKEAKALAKAAKKATKKAKKSKKSQAATSPVVELPQSDSINTTVTTDTMMPVIEWEQSDRIEITEVTEEAEAEMSLSDSPVVELSRSDSIETTAATADTTSDKHSSTTAIIVVILAVLSSAGGAWYILKARKKK